MASKMVAPKLSIPIALCLKCSFCAVNIKKIVLSFDPHIIVRQDGGQDGCYNHNKRFFS